MTARHNAIARAHSRVTHPPDRRVLLTIAARQDVGTVSLDVLASRARISKRSTERALVRLEQMGEILRDFQPHPLPILYRSTVMCPAGCEAHHDR